MLLSEAYTIAFLGIYGGLAAVVFSPIVACRVVRAVFEAPSQRSVSPIRRATLFQITATVAEGPRTPPASRRGIRRARRGQLLGRQAYS